MALKLALPLLGGLGIVGSALVAGVLYNGKGRERSDANTANRVGDNSGKSFRKFSDLVSPSDEGQQCLIFYVSELGDPDDSGIYGYEGYRNTFKSKLEALQELKSSGLEESDLNEVLCGDGYGSRRYALSKEGGRWQTMQV
ncbi:hypothetical protein HF1_13040 [Mycoplasma haemofelis str. Langford 1]|uniref:Uncharacterized protein n=1 Tax=Mycoplasma haemofelis (strain Langford 1) TaxID=941640 RepID=E8ZJJ1_MYCHL|nr:hypothetical protein [Mycoplasma haemofelis]CBY93312.1 hypothetical protein HF1_13040 [Mycoplasma haemofelis str. Langford 1]